MSPNEQAALAELEWELSAPHTLEEIAAHTGLTLRSVARIEARALDKMRAMTTEADASIREPSPLHRGVGRVALGDGRAWWGETRE